MKVIVFNLHSSVHALCCITAPAKTRKNLQSSSIPREQSNTYHEWFNNQNAVPLVV